MAEKRRQISTSVPPGASTGLISVTTPFGTGSSTIPFVVVTPPIITEQPQPQTVPAFSNGPEEYQWLRNGAPIPGNPSADTRTLVLPTVTTADSGAQFVCKVFNNAGHATSLVATLTVTKVQAIVSLSAPAAIYDGTPKSATATTTPPGLTTLLTYSNSPALSINAGSYAVVATIDDANFFGSASATLEIAPAPATIGLTGLVQRYDSMPRIVTATTAPAGRPAVAHAPDRLRRTHAQRQREPRRRRRHAQRHRVDQVRHAHRLRHRRPAHRKRQWTADGRDRVGLP